MRREEEQTLAALCHFFNWVPIWGLILSAVIWFTQREKSPYAAAQAFQAMVFHSFYLAAGFVWMGAEFAALLVGLLASPVGAVLHVLNLLILFAFAVLYIGLCILGGVRCLNGEPFRYPFAGQFSE